MWNQSSKRLFGRTVESLRRIELALQRPRQVELGEIESELLRCIADLQELQAAYPEGRPASVHPDANLPAAGSGPAEDAPAMELLLFRALVRRIRALVDQAAAFHAGWSELAQAEQGYGPGGELPPIHTPVHRVLIRG